MRSWCVKDHLTNHVFKILLTQEEFEEFLKNNPEMKECIDCIECDDAPSICIE